MAAVLRIKLADLLSVMAPGLSSRPEESMPGQLKLIGFRPEKSKNASRIDEQKLRAIQIYLRRGGPASCEDLVRATGMSRKAALLRLNMLKEKGVVEQMPDDTYRLRGDL